MKSVFSVRVAAAIAMLGAGAGLVRADGIDVDDFRVWAEPDGGGWVFTIDYEVEVDDYAVPELELVVTLEHNGLAVANQAGQQVQFAVPLGGTDDDDDDAEFKDRTALAVTDLPSLPGEGLRAVARVYAPGNPHPFATRHTHVRFLTPEVVVYGVAVVQQPVVYYQPGVVVYRTTYVGGAPAYVAPAQPYTVVPGQPVPPAEPQNAAPPPTPAPNTGYPRQPYVAAGGQPYGTRPAGITNADGSHEQGVMSTPPPSQPAPTVPRRQIISPPQSQPGYAGGYPTPEADPDAER